MDGKTIIITGATAGIGLAAAEALAAMGARVVGISRDPDKCARVAGELREKTGNGDIDFFCADLSSLTEIRRVADDLLDQFPRIDVLINNAGALFVRRMLTVDGFERTFALNHLSYFLLTRLLLDRLIASAPARVINVSSSSHYKGTMHFDNLQLERGYAAFRAYQQSKLANVLFTYELDRRLQGTDVTVNAMHPGLVRTDIAKDNGLLFRLLQPWVLSRSRTPEQGAKTIVYLASAPEVEGVSGKFFIDERPVVSAEASYNQADAARLWELSEELIR
ncbi:MAG TPA: SDR family oxidoreductase [Anaerolineales bacterium]|nr:SDR family oxidoreductase [Anaerolineales bacterium]